jgi:hypothetical protein
MRGNQSATNSLLDFWTGTTAPNRMSLWIMMRDCDLFIKNVDRIPDMNVEGKADWKAQAKFLKAYYMFMMVKMYGPVPIPEYVDESGGMNAELFKPRSKVEDCFDYILKLIDEAIPYLKGRRDVQLLGQPDQVTALAIKARVLLQRASPFYNGNADYYGNFLDHNGEHFFAQTPDPEKWKAAADAAQVALDACRQYGFGLYHFKRKPYDYDTTDYRLNTDRMKSLYDLRFRMVERWNEELIWGYQRPENNISTSGASIIRKPLEYGGPAATNDGTGWMQASYQVMERFYTENGLPLEEDRTVNMNVLHEIVDLPDENSPEYAKMRGFMQPRGTPPYDKTINMYMNREPRFYTDLGITGGYYRSHQVRIRTSMLAGQAGGYISALMGEWMPCTGIAVQKNVHPEMYMYNLQSMMLHPYPIMRVSDLYLMYAEALNEYYGPTPEVYAAINEVRIRAGIPTVEEAYGDDSPWVTDEARNKHQKKEGMRDIILRERANEFAFEFAHRFWDMNRWKRSVAEFSRPLYGWDYKGASPEAFFTLKNLQGRKWSITDCLWPIDKKAIEKNPRLIQNPGW